MLERDTTIESSLEAAGKAAGEGVASNGVEVLADSAYGTGDMLARLGASGHTPVIKPWPTKPAVEGGFTIDDFAYDQDAGDRGTLTCPAGVTRSLSAYRTVTFGVACRGCPLRARCTASTKGRTVNVHEHERLSVSTAPAPRTRASKRRIGPTGRWSNDRSRGSCGATAACPTAA